MKHCTWTLAAILVLIAVCNIAESRTIEKRQIKQDGSLQPEDHAEGADHIDWRDKRKIDSKFGIKNALLGFVFNPSSSASSSSSSRRATSTTTKRPTTTEDIVIFEKNKPVSLDLPGELFGTGFGVITNVSKSVGDLMINSALRLHRLLESMRPFIWRLFGKKGLVIEATTGKPIFTDPNEKTNTNSI